MIINFNHYIFIKINHYTLILFYLYMRKQKKSWEERKVGF